MCLVAEPAVQKAHEDNLHDKLSTTVTCVCLRPNILSWTQMAIMMWPA